MFKSAAGSTCGQAVYCAVHGRAGGRKAGKKQAGADDDEAGGPDARAKRKRSGGGRPAAARSKKRTKKPTSSPEGRRPPRGPLFPPQTLWCFASPPCQAPRTCFAIVLVVWLVCLTCNKPSPPNVSPVDPPRAAPCFTSAERVDEALRWQCYEVLASLPGCGLDAHTALHADGLTCSVLLAPRFFTWRRARGSCGGRSRRRTAAGPSAVQATPSTSMHQVSDL